MTSVARQEVSSEGSAASIAMRNPAFHGQCTAHNQVMSPPWLGFDPDCGLAQPPNAFATIAVAVRRLAS